MNEISHTYLIEAPPGEVFAYYTDPYHVARMTPSELNLRIVKAEIPLHKGSRVVFATRPRMIPFEIQWLIEISDYDPPNYFVDRLVKGPFIHWEHRHCFEAADGGKTQVTDSISFSGLNPFLERLLPSSMIERKLREIFLNRERVMQREFVSRK